MRSAAAGAMQPAMLMAANVSSIYLALAWLQCGLVMFSAALQRTLCMFCGWLCQYGHQTTDNLIGGCQKERADKNEPDDVSQASLELINLTTKRDSTLFEN